MKCQVLIDWLTFSVRSTKGPALKIGNDREYADFLEKKMLGVQEDEKVDKRKRFSPAAALAVENGAELIMDSFQINWGVWLAFIVLIVQHLILPRDDLVGGNIAHLQLTKVGYQLGSDNMIFRSPSVFLDTSFHVRRVLLHKAGKGHVQI